MQLINCCPIRIVIKWIHELSDLFTKKKDESAITTTTTYVIDKKGETIFRVYGVASIISTINCLIISLNPVYNWLSFVVL